MNSDPTGYFTLAEVSATLNVQNILRNTAVSSLVGGFFSMIDALAGGETDPIELLNRYRDGALNGAVMGAFLGQISALGQLSCRMRLFANLFLGGISTYFGVKGAEGAVESFREGNYWQSFLRKIPTCTVLLYLHKKSLFTVLLLR